MIFSGVELRAGSACPCFWQVFFSQFSQKERNCSSFKRFEVQVVFHKVLHRSMRNRGHFPVRSSRFSPYSIDHNFFQPRSCYRLWSTASWHIFYAPSLIVTLDSAINDFPSRFRDMEQFQNFP